jgi:hypothetical protein
VLHIPVALSSRRAECNPLFDSHHFELQRRLQRTCGSGRDYPDRRAASHHIQRLLRAVRCFLDHQISAFWFFFEFVTLAVALRRTPLHRASSPNYSSAQGNPQVGYLLLRIGGEPLAFAKDEQGNTALHLASFSAEDSVAKLLVLYFPGLLQVRNKKGRSARIPVWLQMPVPHWRGGRGGRGGAGGRGGGGRSHADMMSSHSFV